MRRISFILPFLLVASSLHAEEAGSCNIADVMFGKVRVELIPNKKDGFETGIIFGDDFDSKRFTYGNILGKIASPERDGSRRISDTKQNVCGILSSDGSIDTSDSDCASCDKKAAIRLQKVTRDSFAVISDGSIMGTITGRMPNNTD